MSAVEWWFVVQSQALARRESLLEFGSGTTFPSSRLLAHLFAERYATDIEDVPPERWPDGVTFRQCSPTSMPMESSRFDVIVIRSVMEHVAEPHAVFTELARVLRPGGVVLMNLPNKWDYVSVLARLSGGLKSTALRHTLDPQWEDFPVYYRANTKRALVGALNGTGLSLETFRPLPSEPSYLSFFVPFYLLGAFYQFAISVLALDFLQPAFLVMLRKSDA